MTKKNHRSKEQDPAQQEATTLGELIHREVRRAIEQAVEEELAAALGAGRYERNEERRGSRNGARERTLAGPTGPVDLTVPRGRLEGPNGEDREWSSKLLPRYQRRMPELNEAVLAAYLSGANTRRLKGALRPLLKDAPLSKSAVSRVVGTLKASFEAWRQRSLSDLDVVYVYLDAIALKVRSAGRVVNMPALVAVAVLSDGQKRLISLELCAGGESYMAWKGFVRDLAVRKMPSPLLCIIDGDAGLRKAVGNVWPQAKVQRCTVHKLRNIERKVPNHAIEEVKQDYHRIVYATSGKSARQAYKAFVDKWGQRCAGAARSLEEGGDELLTYFSFPKGQWKTLRTTNVIERLNEEFRRRVKTQSSFPNEDAAAILLFGLVASGQITLRRIDGYRTIPQAIRKHQAQAAPASRS